MIRRIENIEDRVSGTVTYELGDGSCIRLDARAVAEYGLAELLRSAGIDYQAPSERVPVMQGGRQVGTVPGDFDPLFIKSKSFLYDPRPGDFKLVDGKWVADRMLGMGDLDAIPGFRMAS